MKAIRIYGRGGPEHLVYEEAPRPQPGQGAVLVCVAARSMEEAAKGHARGKLVPRVRD